MMPEGRDQGRELPPFLYKPFFLCDFVSRWLLFSFNFLCLLQSVLLCNMISGQFLWDFVSQILPDYVGLQ